MSAIYQALRHLPDFPKMLMWQTFGGAPLLADAVSRFWGLGVPAPGLRGEEHAAGPRTQKTDEVTSPTAAAGRPLGASEGARRLISM